MTQHAVPFDSKSDGRRRRGFSEMREIHEQCALLLMSGVSLTRIADHLNFPRFRLRDVFENKSRYLTPETTRALRDFKRRERQERNQAVMQVASRVNQAPFPAAPAPEDELELARLRETVLCQAQEIARLRSLRAPHLG